MTLPKKACPIPKQTMFNSAQFLTAINQLKLINEMTGSHIQPMVDIKDFMQPTHFDSLPKVPDWLSDLHNPSNL